MPRKSSETPSSLPRSFRFDARTARLLDALSEHLAQDKTAVIREGLRLLARREKAMGFEMPAADD